MRHCVLSRSEHFMASGTSQKVSNDDLREINGMRLIFIAKLMPRCFNASRVCCVVLTIVYDYTTPRDGPKTKCRRPRQTFLVSDTKQQSERESSEQ